MPISWFSMSVGHRAWYAFLRYWARLLFVIFFRIRTFGRDNVPKRGGALLVSNHQSFLDPVIASLGLDRPVSYFARRELFRNRLFRFLIVSLNAFPVRRGEVDMEAMREAVGRLEDGQLLLIFPEGTRTSTGEIGRMRAGMCAIAARADVPVIPTVIEGAFKVWPRTRRLFRFGKISVIYGAPVFVAEKTRAGYEESAREVGREMIRLQERAQKLSRGLD